MQLIRDVGRTHGDRAVIKRSKVFPVAVVLAVASCGPQRPAILAALAQAEKLTIQEGWGGLGCGSLVEYTLHRTPRGFEGNATISITARSGQTVPGQMIPVIVPATQVGQFLQDLVTVPLSDGPYVPRFDHTDDYPSRRIVFDTPTGPVTYFSKSQGTDANPWALQVPGRQYVIPSGGPAKALRGMSAALKTMETQATVDAMCRQAERRP